jgi:hypothetical protein
VLRVFEQLNRPPEFLLLTKSALAGGGRAQGLGHLGLQPYEGLATFGGSSLNAWPPLSFFPKNDKKLN